MPIVFNKVERANPLDRTQPKKWYPILKTLSQVGESEVARTIPHQQECKGKTSSRYNLFNNHLQKIEKHPVPIP
jgi:hypothetical protein